jgi:hypothetical protein
MVKPNIRRERGGGTPNIRHDVRFPIVAASVGAFMIATVGVIVGVTVAGDPGVKREPTEEEQPLCELDLAKLGADPRAKFLDAERSVRADGVEEVEVPLSDGSLFSVEINRDGEFSKIIFRDSGGDKHPVDSEVIGC